MHLSWARIHSLQESAPGTYETSGLSWIGSTFEVDPDIGPPLSEVRI